MRTAIRYAALTVTLFASFTLNSSQVAFAEFATPCTLEQEAAYKPFDYDLDAVGCDESTFRTCTDDCLNMYQVAAEHAPDCGSSSLSRPTMTYRCLADSAVKNCERVRANTTNKYFPQAVPGVPKCSYDVYDKFNWNISHAVVSNKCFKLGSTECSDESVKVIENQIVNAATTRSGRRPSTTS